MDLADQIDDYICSFEGIGDLTMDSLAMFIFIWAVLALFLVWLCKFLYNKYVVEKNNKPPTSNSNSRQSSVAPLNGAAATKTEKQQRLSEPRDILASKTDIKELAASKGGGSGSFGARGRAAGGSLGAGGGGGGGGARRRIVRQSSTGPENRKKRYVPPPSNVVGPETTSVTWTSQVFRWLYSDLVIVNELLLTWVIALNDTLKKSTEEQGVAVEIVRVLPDSPPPALNNIFCNANEHNPSEMLTTFDCDAMPVLQVKTFRQKSGKVETSHYKATVSRFRARMAISINYNTLKGEMRVEGYPDVRIGMNSVGAIKPSDQDEQQLQEVISEILATALRDTIYPVDFSVYATCPRAEVDPMDLSQNLDNSSLQPHEQMISGRRLLVKVVKGEGLKNAIDPYVVIEMDEPAQKNQTGARQGSNPYWDEHFLFELSPQSAEILFEVYDRPTNTNDAPKFLGLGLVGIDELAVGPASTQLLSLQPRPYETQTVSGAITVDFVFVEGAEIPAGPRPYKLKEALRISNPLANEYIKNSDNLADAAVRALNDGVLASSGQQSNKSTLIIHSVQRNNDIKHTFKVELNKDGKLEMKETQDLVDGNDKKLMDDSVLQNPTTEDELITTTTTTTTTTELSSPNDLNAINDDNLKTGNDGNDENAIKETIVTEFGQPNAASSPNGHHNDYQFNGTNGNNSNYLNNTNSLQRNGTYNMMTSSTSQTTNLNAINADYELDDDRSRSKKRNFFGTLKKRLSRSKTRTHSADRDAAQLAQLHNNNGTTPTGTLNGDSRSLSVDRGVLSKSNSLGPRMGTQTLDHSRRSSISESSAISGFSTSSNKTYIHEASTLVLETIENGIKRHFIVPLAIAQRPRWRRKGTKLHIYNDHTFIAKHLSGSGLQCTICMKSIPRRPGKQGYECRDCHLICHKQCHIRAPQSCPNPTVLSMELTKLNSTLGDSKSKIRF